MTCQRRINGKVKKTPKPLPDAGQEFREEVKERFASQKAAKEKVVHKKTAPAAGLLPQDNATNLLLPSASTAAATPKSDRVSFKDPLISLSSPEMTDNPSFFKKDISPALLASAFIDTCEQTCKLEQNKKDNDDKKQKAVGATVDIQEFTEDI
jgi:hypothetical protein